MSSGSLAWDDAEGSAGTTACRFVTASSIGATATSATDTVDFVCIRSDRSVRRAAADQIRGRGDHALAMSEQPLGVTADEIELVLPAFLVHRPDVLDRMRARHLGHELRQQVR